MSELRQRSVRSATTRKNVLLSYGPPALDANPFTTLFEESISPEFEVTYFSWRTALTGSYAVFNLHWPETLLRRRTPIGKLASLAFATALLARLKLSRTPVVRVLHNRVPHESGGALERMILRAFDKATTTTIAMNEPDARETRNSVHIPHGHYRDWYPKLEEPLPRKRNQALYFGLLRPYKGVDELITAFRGISPTAGVSLTIQGNAKDPVFLASVVAQSADTAGITIDARHIPDAELSRSIRTSSLVVLPYRKMSNSGAAILALSLETPVLVPRNEITVALREEVGPNWVHLFDGSLRSEDIVAALDRVATQESGSPNLDLRNWKTIGRQYRSVFSSTIAGPRAEHLENL